MEKSDKLKTFYVDFKGAVSRPKNRYNKVHSELDKMVEELGPIRIIRVSDEIIYKKQSYGYHETEQGMKRTLIYQTLESKVK